MNIYKSKQWMMDLDEMVENIPELNELSGNSVMITGATGLICSSIVDILIRYNHTHKEKITIFAAGRQMDKLIHRFPVAEKQDCLIFILYDALKWDNTMNFRCDYIIHGANLASPNKIVKEPVETMLSNFMGMNHLLDYARKNNTKKVLYISSSEIYGKKDGAQPYKENEYGFIDLLNSRNSYSVGKRATETLCASYFDEYGTASVIARPGHIYGPTASPQDTRVSSAWAYAVARGENIIMKSDGSQLRSYCYCLDCASAILKVLIKGKNADAYNISNPDSILSIRQMAEILTASANVNLEMELPTQEEKKRFNPMSNSSLDSTKLIELGWKGLFNAERGFSHTVKILKEMID